MTVERLVRAAPHQHDLSRVSSSRAVSLVANVDAPVTVARLARAAAELSQHYEILRTRLEASAGGMLQRVLPPDYSVVVVADRLAGFPGGDAGLVWVAPGADPCQLILQSPPAQLDFSSLLQLARLLADACRTGSNDVLHLSEPEVQFGDAAEWLHDLMGDPGAAIVGRQVSEHAVSEPASSAALAELTKAAGARGTGGRVRRMLPLPLEPATGRHPADLLLAAWQIVLHRYTAATELTVWHQVDLRTVPELAPVLGPLSMRLPVAFRPDKCPRLADVVEAVAEATGLAQRNVEVLAECASSEGSFGLAVLEQPPADLQLQDAQIATGRFGLDLSAWPVDGGMLLELWSPPGAGPSEEQAHRLLESVAVVAEAIVSVPETPVATVRLGAEPPTPPWTAPGPRALGWHGHTLAGLVAAAARQSPERIAARAGYRQLSYQALLERADGVASGLTEQGIGPEDVVAVGCDDPLRGLVAQLGVALAGAAFLPVNPTDPVSRLAYVLADSRVRAMVTDRPAEQPTVPVLFVESLAAGGTGQFHPPAVPNQERSLCYLLYTSGSTGRPKGVAVETGSVVNYLAWLVDIGLVTSETVLPAVTPPWFDASLKQVWAPLVTGGTVLFPDTDEDPLTFLAAAIASGTATAVNTVPSLWRDVLPRLRKPCHHRVRHVLLGGEPLQPQLVSDTGETLPGAVVWNLYGPTETTANASGGPVGDLITLGQPVAGCLLRVLDSSGSPVPVGAVGELCVSGPAVARGYVGRGGLTAGRFVPDDSSQLAGARLYRTGDLARQLDEARIQLVGRSDSQLKVNGVRVEPSEVESVLREHPDVIDAAVTGHDGRLVGYLVTGPHPPSVPDLYSHCTAYLPAPMVPSRFVRIGHLPRTPAGKLDRGNLPAPDSCASLHADGMEARSDEELVVRHLWADVLGNDRFGVDDSFFTVGGDSIRAMRLVALLREVVGIPVSLRELLTTQTLSGQAQLLRQHDNQHLLTDFAKALAALNEELT